MAFVCFSVSVPEHDFIVKPCDSLLAELLRDWWR